HRPVGSAGWSGRVIRTLGGGARPTGAASLSKSLPERAAGVSTLGGVVIAPGTVKRVNDARLRIRHYRRPAVICTCGAALRRRPTVEATESSFRPGSPRRARSGAGK